MAPAHAQAALAHAQAALAVLVDLVAPVDLVLVPAGQVHARVVPALVPVVPVARPWVARVPVGLVGLVQAADPEVPVDPVVRVPVVREATVRMVSVAHRARSRVPVDVGTWMSCNRS